MTIRGVVPGIGEVMKSWILGSVGVVVVVVGRVEEVVVVVVE